MDFKTPRRPESYFRLVNQFPLARIQDEAHLCEAQALIDTLLQEELDEGGEQYLEVLTGLVEAYEEANHPIPDAAEGDVLRELLRANGLSQAKLARTVGIAQSTLSAVLNGNRSLTREQVTKLARFFHVSPLAFQESD